jgi:hypothetical protein
MAFVAWQCGGYDGPMVRRRQFSLLQLVAWVTAFAAFLALIRYLLQGSVADQLLRVFEVLVAVLVCTMLPAATCWSFYRAMRQTLFWPQAQAVVMRYYIRRNEAQAFFHPVLRFELPDGSTITTISRFGSVRRRWKSGDAVPVRYDPANPRSVEIATFILVWGLPLACLALTVLAALVLWWFR